MRYTALVPLLLLAGCEVVRPPTAVDPDGESVQVHSVLWARSDTVAVLVERTWVEGGYVRTQPVSGARARIAGGGVEVALKEAPAGFPACLGVDHRFGHPGRPIGPGCYAGLLPGGVRAGESYSLAIELADGRSIAGRTTVPALPEFLHPAEGARLPLRRIFSGSEGMVDSLLLQWPPQEGGSRTWPALLPRAVYAGGSLVARGECHGHLSGMNGVSPGGSSYPHALGDSLRVRAHIVSCREAGAPGAAPRELRPDSVEAVLSTSAFDSAYTAYYRDSEGGVREKSASRGLTGAYGVFGSAATARRRVVLLFTDR